jgi:hypothetical protein
MRRIDAAPGRSNDKTNANHYFELWVLVGESLTVERNKIAGVTRARRVRKSRPEGNRGGRRKRQDEYAYLHDLLHA